MVALSDVCQIIMGQAPAGDTYNSTGVGFPLIAGAGDFGEIYPRPKKFTSAKDVRTSVPGDVIVGIRASIGDKVLADDVYCLGRGVAGLRAGPRLDQRYLWNWVTHAAPTLLAKGRGATFLQVNKNDIAELEIPLPPIEEQRRIASILDAADALRTKRRLALAKLGTLTQAIFIDMFGDPLSKNGRYEYRSVGDLALNEDAKRVPVKMSDRALVKGIYPYYGASGIIDYVDDYLYEGQRLLVAEDGANLLARSSPVAFLANGKYWVNNHAHVLADNGEANLTFLRQAIESLDLMPFVTGSAQPKLTRKMLDSIAVPAPPRSTQDEFEARVLGLKLVETDSTQGLEYLEALFVSLQHRAFRGEL
jgi:type I restriction enzyme S subunit